MEIRDPVSRWANQVARQARARLCTGAPQSDRRDYEEDFMWNERSCSRDRSRGATARRGLASVIIALACVSTSGGLVGADEFRAPISVVVLAGRDSAGSSITVRSLLPGTAIASEQIKVFDADGRLNTVANTAGNNTGVLTVTSPGVARGQRVHVQALIRDLADSSRTVLSEQATTVLWLPDLSATGASASSPYFVNEAGTVTVTVKELNGDTGASASLALRDGATVLGTQPVTVAAGETATATFTPTFTTSGVHELTATLEGITPTDDVVANNVWSFTVTVQSRTDLAIVATDASEPFYAGTLGTVVVKVQEVTGRAGATASLVIREGAFVLGSRPVAVGPGSSTTEGVGITLGTSGLHQVTAALENISPGDNLASNNTRGLLIDVRPAIVGPGCSAGVPVDALLGIELTPSAANLTPGQHAEFQAFGYYKADPWTPVDITGLVAWAAADDGRLSVSGNDVAATSSYGLSRVTASLDGVSNYANIRVWDAARLAAQTGMSVTAPWNVTHGTCQQLRATATFNDDPNDTEDVTLSTKWSPGHLGGKIFQDGLFAIVGPSSDNYFWSTVSGDLVPGGPRGTADAAVWGHRFAGSCADPRSPGALWGIRTSPGPITLQVTEATRIGAEGLFADGSSRDISDTARFTTTSAAVLEVAPDGIVTGVAPGTGTAVVVQEDIAGTSCVTVRPAAPLGNLTALSLEPPNTNPTVGGRLSFTALGTYDAQPGRMFNVTALGTWASSDPSITSPAHGIGLAEQVGRAIVAVSLDGAVAQGNVRVWDPAQVAALRALIVQPELWHMPANTCQQLRSWAVFDGYPDEEVTDSTIWRILSGAANLSTTGRFCPIGGNRYWYLTASIGRGVLRPTPITIGVWY
jgi:hypothetical protein